MLKKIAAVVGMVVGMGACGVAEAQELLQNDPPTSNKSVQIALSAALVTAGVVVGTMHTSVCEDPRAFNVTTCFGEHVPGMSADDIPRYDRVRRFQRGRVVTGVVMAVAGVVIPFVDVEADRNGVRASKTFGW